MKLNIGEAKALALAALKAIKMDDDAAAATADHLVDAALRGVTFGSLPRILAIAEKMQEGDSRRPVKVVRDTPVSAQRRATSAVSKPVSSSQPRAATRPPRTSIATTCAFASAANRGATSCQPYAKSRKPWTRTNVTSPRRFHSSR